MTADLDVLVVGAGVVGLAVARALARAGREVVVLEAEASIGHHTSSRNSEVLHGGLHYPPGSRKLATCVRGLQRLTAFCRNHRVSTAWPGKLVLATDQAQVPGLLAMASRARAAGAGCARVLTADAVARREPAVRAVAGLWVPWTGLIDSHGLLLALQGELEAHGGALALRSRVTGLAPVPAGVAVTLMDDAGQASTVTARAVVNCAGLGAWQLARATTGLDPARVPPQHLARGHYYNLVGRHPFRHLVYPVPEPGGLGVHLTLDLAGQARFGPDVRWCDAVDYQFDDSRRMDFARAVQRWWPGLDPQRLQPGYVGVRPKVVGAGGGAGDFVLLGPRQQAGQPVVHLFGIESPGLTACLALAEDVALALGLRPVAEPSC